MSLLLFFPTMSMLTFRAMSILCFNFPGITVFFFAPGHYYRYQTTMILTDYVTFKFHLTPDMFGDQQECDLALMREWIAPNDL